MSLGDIGRETEIPGAYSRSQKLLHWMVVLLIALQYLLFDRMGGAFNAIMRGEAGAYTLSTWRISW